MSNIFYYLEMNYDKLIGFMVETGTIAILKEMETYQDVFWMGNKNVSMLYDGTYSTKVKTDIKVDNFNIYAKIYLMILSELKIKKHELRINR